MPPAIYPFSRTSHRVIGVIMSGALLIHLYKATLGEPGTLRTSRTFYGFYRVVEPEPGLHVLVGSVQSVRCRPTDATSRPEPFSKARYGRSVRSRKFAAALRQRISAD